MTLLGLAGFILLSGNLLRVTISSPLCTSIIENFRGSRKTEVAPSFILPRNGGDTERVLATFAHCLVAALPLCVSAVISYLGRPNPNHFPGLSAAALFSAS